MTFVDARVGVCFFVDPPAMSKNYSNFGVCWSQLSSRRPKNLTEHRLRGGRIPVKGLQ